MKMTTAQYEVWVNANVDVGPYYYNMICFVDCLESADTNLYYSLTHDKSWFDDVFPEFRNDTRRFVRV